MEELLTLREQILADIVPLVLEGGASGQEQFGLLLRIIQSGNANVDIYNKAYESAKSIDDRGERLNALMDLLSEVEFSTQEQAGTDMAEVVVQQPAPAMPREEDTHQIAVDSLQQ